MNKITPNFYTRNGSLSVNRFSSIGLVSGLCKGSFPFSSLEWKLPLFTELIGNFWFPDSDKKSVGKVTGSQKLSFFFLVNRVNSWKGLPVENVLTSEKH